MSNNGSSNKAHRLSIVGRMTENMLNHQFGRFAAELTLIVAGVLIALAIDGAVSDARDRKAEVTYLELLSRDMSEIKVRVASQIEFEKHQIGVAATAYDALSKPDPAAHRKQLESSLGLLNTRRTLILNSVTYDQMVSTGQLQLISNVELRDEIARYFNQMQLLERIVERNNREFVDNIYIPFMMRTGITMRSNPNEPSAILSRANDIIASHLGTSFVYPQDRILSAPADADSWNDIRRNVLLRARISAIAQAIVEDVVAASDEMAEAIATELDDR